METTDLPSTSVITTTAVIVSTIQCSRCGIEFTTKDSSDTYCSIDCTYGLQDDWTFFTYGRIAPEYGIRYW